VRFESVIRRLKTVTRNKRLISWYAHPLYFDPETVFGIRFLRIRVGIMSERLMQAKILDKYCKLLFKNQYIQVVGIALAREEFLKLKKEFMDIQRYPELDTTTVKLAMCLPRISKPVPIYEVNEMSEEIGFIL